MESWRVGAPGTVEAVVHGGRRPGGPAARRLDVLLGAGLVVVELGWIAALVWALSLVL